MTDSKRLRYNVYSEISEFLEDEHLSSVINDRFVLHLNPPLLRCVAKPLPPANRLYNP